MREKMAYERRISVLYFIIFGRASPRFIFEYVPPPLYATIPFNSSYAQHFHTQYLRFVLRKGGGEQCSIEENITPHEFVMKYLRKCLTMLRNQG